MEKEPNRDGFGGPVLGCRGTDSDWEPETFQKCGSNCIGKAGLMFRYLIGCCKHIMTFKFRLFLFSGLDIVDLQMWIGALTGNKERSKVGSSTEKTLSAIYLHILRCCLPQ